MLLILLKKSLPISVLSKAVLLIVITTAILITTISTPFLTTLSMNKTVSQQRSTSGRMAILNSGLDQVKIQPFTGIGNDNYPLINSVGTNLQEDQGSTYLATTTYLQLAVEKGIITLIGATTENPSFEVISALLSRCQVYVLKPLIKDELIFLVNQ